MRSQSFDETIQLLQVFHFPQYTILSLHLVANDTFHRHLWPERLEEEHVLDEERKKVHLDLKCCRRREMLMLEKGQGCGYIELKSQGLILEEPISTWLASTNSLNLPSLLEGLETVVEALRLTWCCEVEIAMQIVGLRKPVKKNSRRITCQVHGSRILGFSSHACKAKDLPIPINRYLFLYIS